MVVATTQAEGRGADTRCLAAPQASAIILLLIKLSSDPLHPVTLRIIMSFMATLASFRDRERDEGEREREGKREVETEMKKERERDRAKEK